MSYYTNPRKLSYIYIHSSASGTNLCADQTVTQQPKGTCDVPIHITDVGNTN